MSDDRSDEVPEMGADISAGQKMLSAVSGSLLTSLLGSSIRRPVKQTVDIY